MDAYAFHIGQLALYGWDDGAAEYHHDQECRALRGVLAQPGY